MMCAAVNCLKFEVGKRTDLSVVCRPSAAPNVQCDVVMLPFVPFPSVIGGSFAVEVKSP